MKVEVGNFYKSRNGTVVGPMGDDSGDVVMRPPWNEASAFHATDAEIAFVFGGFSPYGYDKEGLGGRGEWDLVQRLPTPPNLIHQAESLFSDAVRGLVGSDADHVMVSNAVRAFEDVLSMAELVSEAYMRMVTGQSPTNFEKQNSFNAALSKRR